MTEAADNEKSTEQLEAEARAALAATGATVDAPAAPAAEAPAAPAAPAAKKASKPREASQKAAAPQADAQAEKEVLTTMVKHGEKALEVHPLCVADHIRAGWTVQKQ